MVCHSNLVVLLLLETRETLVQIPASSCHVTTQLMSQQCLFSPMLTFANKNLLSLDWCKCKWTLGVCSFPFQVIEQF